MKEKINSQIAIAVAVVAGNEACGLIKHISSPSAQSQWIVKNAAAQRMRECDSATATETQA